MKPKEAKRLLKKTIEVNNAVIKEARKNGDLNVIELTDDLDTQSTAIETVLQELDNSISKDKVKEKIDNIFTVFYERYECDYQDIQNVISEVHKALKQELLEDK